MSPDPLESPDARAWLSARREAPVPAGFVPRPPGGPLRTAGRLAHMRLDWLRAVAVLTGGAWFLARLAGLLLPFTTR